MNNLKKTNEWIRKTNENMDEERAYTAKVANGENTDDFNITKTRNRWGKYKQNLVVSHDIEKYDQTIYDFITETSKTFELLNNKIALLEEQIVELKNK
jgi:hypothetical protein